MEKLTLDGGNHETLARTLWGNDNLNGHFVPERLSNKTKATLPVIEEP